VSAWGFTLIEILVVLVLLAVLAVITIVAINPLEQLKRARDTASSENASALLRATGRYQATNEKNPQIVVSASSTDCNDIIETGPVYDISPLGNEVPEWFSKQITQEGSQLYVGISKDGRTKVCFKVEAVVNITKAQSQGCSVIPYYYLCVPN